jgi:hypothetical protein
MKPPEDPRAGFEARVVAAEFKSGPTKAAFISIELFKN